MKLARVIGKVVLSRQIASYEERTLHLIQDLNEDLEPVGDPEVCATWRAMEEEDLVIVEVSREATHAFDPPVPVDAVILGKVESVHIDRGDGEG